MDQPDFRTTPLQRLMGTTWPLFRAFRVDVRVSWTVLLWPLFLALQFGRWMSAGEAILWGSVWTAALYATTWTHEMGHIAAGRRCGIETERISLRALGGLAHLGAPAQTPRDEILIALAGPAVHLVWMAVLYPAIWLLRADHDAETWFAMLSSLGRLQLSMMVFNLLPVHPLDGGRTLRGALALRMDATRASYWAANAGFAGNAVFIVLGALSLFKVADPFGYGPFGFLLVWIGIEGIQACRRLRFEAQQGDVYGEHDPFQKTLLASQAAMRDLEDDERKEREARRTAQERRRELQATADRLLDRINEVGGVDKLSASERRELERASRELSQER